MMDRKWANERQDDLDEAMRSRQDALDARAERFYEQQRKSARRWRIAELAVITIWAAFALALIGALAAR